MTETLLLALKFLAALGCGLLAGLFFAFSVAVMGALGRLEPAAGIAAMQSINRVIINPWFLIVFLGTPALCLLLMALSLWRWHDPGTAYLLLGGALLVIGTFVVTMVFNVPLNNALEAAAASDPASASLWSRYLATWTAWNHVRTIAALAATALITLAIYLQARGPGAG